MSRDFDAFFGEASSSVPRWRRVLKSIGVLSEPSPHRLSAPRNERSVALDPVAQKILFLVGGVLTTAPNSGSWILTLNSGRRASGIEAGDAPAECGVASASLV